MKEKLSKLSRSTAFTVLLFALAACLLLGGTVGSTRAALTYYSETYTSRVQMHDIGVSLLENGSRISWRDYGSRADGTWSENTGVLLGNMLGESEKLQLGHGYTEELAVRNSGTIDQYVRVIIYKYWADGDEKLRGMDPELIDLHLVNTGDEWIVDREASTPERTVLYYHTILRSGETSVPFSDTLSIDKSIERKSETVTAKDGSTTTVYEYDGCEFQVEVEVDAVQIHNAEDAIWSAWGRQVTINGDRLSLN